MTPIRSLYGSPTTSYLPRRPVDYLDGLGEGPVPTPRGAPDGDHRVDPMFNPRRFADLGDYVS